MLIANSKKNSLKDHNSSEGDTDLKPKKPKKYYDQTIISAWCKGCGICVAFCPKKVFTTNDMGMPVIQNPDQCIGCRFCELHCPDFAIAIRPRKSGNQSEKV